MSSSEKSSMNGIDSGPSTGGFRHQMPQIPLMTRSTKIAQSKSFAKGDVTITDHSTTDVEGVGTVVHIGSEVMEVDDSTEKLLEQLENYDEKSSNDVTSAEILCNSEPVAIENKHTNKDNAVVIDTQVDDEKMDSNDNETMNSSVEINTSKSDVTKNNEAEDTSKATVDSSPVKSNSFEFSFSKTNSPVKAQPIDSGNAESIVETPAATGSKTKSPNKNLAADNSKTRAGRVSTPRLKLKQAADTSDQSNTSLQEDLSLKNPIKRQRKPKKFEDDEEQIKTAVKSPTVDKPDKSKVVAEKELESKFPVMWQLGDLVWAKVSGHPWWPCMISNDPFTSVYTRITRNRDYHVQFFGDSPERAWIGMNNLLEFKGQKDFKEYVAVILKNAKTPKEQKRLKKWYETPANRAKAVDVGIFQAEIALPLSRSERKASYTFTYEYDVPHDKKDKGSDSAVAEHEEDLKIIKGLDNDHQKCIPAKKRKHEETETPYVSKTAAKRRKIETPKIEKLPKSPSAATPSTKSPPATTPTRKSSKKTLRSGTHLASGTQGSFEVFCQKEKENVMEEHPEFSDIMLMDYCRQQWCMMSKKQKARYRSKYAEEPATQDSSIEMSATRNRRKSMKALEAEADNNTEVLSSKKSETPELLKTVRRPRTLIAVAVTEEKTPRQELKVAEKKKRIRASESVEDACVKEEQIVNKTVKQKSLQQHDSSMPTEDTVLCDTIPAKRVRPQKSSSTDSQSDKQIESGRSTPSLILEALPPPKCEQEDYEYEMEIYKLSSAGPQKKENLCQICEQTGELLECLGPCQGYFHMECLGLSAKPDGDFKCDECTSGVMSCFICKKSDADTQHCSVPICGKFYHIDCVKQYPQAKVEGKGITCPLHSCHTCFAHNLKGSAKANGRLLRCIRCPTAYHVGDFCIAAGSINLTGFNIVCAKHFQPIPSLKHHSHVNVGWCFSCDKGGTLLCCESCPAAYHAECLNIEFPTGSWYCADCVKGKRPLYGQIIWIKLGNYRWWPGEVCHPRNVPVNIQEKTHQVGEFPVHFLGSHEYFWLHQGRVFSFQDGDKGGSSSSTNKGLTKCFTKGLQEAQEAYKVWKEFRDNKEQLELARESKKPPSFKMVKTNIPLGNVTIKKADLSDLPRCECKPDQENPCGRDSDCLNAMMMYECHTALCPTGEKCQNQFFTKRQYPAQQPYKTEGRGWGLKAMEDIKKGHFVNEYVGDLIDEEECKKRLEKAHVDDISNFYMMTLDMDRIIDAGPKGNLSRFMNHSCAPNLETQKWNVNGDVRVGLFALKDIKAGEELTFNYNFDCLGNEQKKCECGAHNCSGYLGVRPKAQNAQVEKKDANLTKLKKKKKIVVKLKRDNGCFRCGEGGELVMCDRSTCPKSYHLTCLQMNKPPHGKWDCPWHHCDECGNPAVQKCVECPNSYCTAHAERNIRKFDKKTYCREHNELLKTLAESQPENSTVSEENCTDTASDQGKGANIGKPIQIENTKKEVNSGNKKADGETLPLKKRASKSQLDVSKDKTFIGGPDSKGLKGRKGSKADQGSKGSVSDDPLAVAPMFDDDEEGFGLVIDIPNF